jgi:RimJ/RimL family protein N-acetyltransferase
MSLLMRDVSIQDSMELLEWRNELSVRKFSHDPGLIKRETHDIWLKHRLLNLPHQPFWVFTKNFEKIGFIRFDLGQLKNEHKVSILLNPLFRGEGYGTLILTQSIEICLARIPYPSFCANIHKDNTASRKLFLKCGFFESETEGNFIRCKRITDSIVHSTN